MRVTMLVTMMVVAVMMRMSLAGRMSMAFARNKPPMALNITGKFRDLVMLPKLAVFLVCRQKFNGGQFVVGPALGRLEHFEPFEFGPCRPILGGLDVCLRPRRWRKRAAQIFNVTECISTVPRAHESFGGVGLGFALHEGLAASLKGTAGAAGADSHGNSNLSISSKPAFGLSDLAFQLYQSRWREVRLTKHPVTQGLGDGTGSGYHSAKRA